MLNNNMKNNFVSDDFEIDDTTLVRYKGNSAEVVVPKGITKIGEDAFGLKARQLNFDSCVESVDLPEGVEVIGVGAFNHCFELKRLNIPSSVKVIEECAFSVCGITELVIPQGVVSICDEAFERSELHKITLPSSLTHIGERVFMCCEHLSITYTGTRAEWEKIDKAECWDADIVGDYTLTCADGDINTKIEPDAAGFIIDGTKLKVYIGESGDIVIPARVTRIVPGAFAYRTELETIDVSEDNETYFAQCNCVIEKASGTLVLGCKNSALTMNVKHIGKKAFQGCGNLTEIAIMNSLESIGEQAFWNCNLKSIDYDGTIEQWEAIAKGYEWDRNTRNYTVYCKDGYIRKDGTVIASEIDFEIDGTTLVKYKGSNPNVVIPDFITHVAATVDGYGRCYFAFGTNGTGDCVKSITIPKSLTDIDEWTFNMCHNLEEIIVDEQNEKYYSEGNCIIERGSKTLICACKASVIPQEVKKIAHRAFVSIYPPYAEHRELIIINYNGTKEQWNCIEKETFWDESLSQYIIRCTDGDITFDDDPFVILDDGFLWDYRGSSEKVVIPDSVTYINGDDYEGSFCFADCGFVRSIMIPKCVKDIDGTTFYGCSNLEEIIVDSQNQNYYSQDNCVIERKSGRLVAGCRTSIIPDGVTGIGYKAFWECSGLKSIAIPSGVTAIGHNAFECCENLTNITLPSSIKKIGQCAFYNCTGLTSINFQGTATQWTAIEKGEYWDISTDDYIVHCTDGDIIKERK